MKEEQKKKKPHFFILCGSIYMIFAAIPVLYYFLHHTDWVSCVKWGVCGFIALSLLFFVLSGRTMHGLRMEKPGGRSLFWCIFSCMVTGTLIVISPWFFVGQLFMIASITGAVLIGQSFGFGLHICFTILYLGINNFGIEKYTETLVLGGMFCFMTLYFREVVNAVYIIVLFSAMQVSMLFILNDFTYLDMKAVAFVVASLLVMIAMEFLISYLKMDDARVSGEALRAEEAEACEELPVSGEDEQEQIQEAEEEKVDLSFFVQEEFELFARLKRASQPLYEHCRKVGDTAEKAAELLGADRELAKVGGYYHEIGRLRTDGVKRNYIENGLIHLKEHGFPEEVCDIIRQHNYKNEKPKTKEAALVMLSDSVFSTIEYIRQHGPHELGKQQEVIEKMLKLRAKNGSLDESGLLVKDYNELCLFFHEVTSENLG